MGSGIAGWLRRGNGILLLGFSAIGWLGLLSWELPAAGVSAASGLITHFLGHVPAAIADFLLQSFGVAAAVMFAVPTFWGIEQLARQPLKHPLRRVILWPASVLAAAGGLSALPSPANWPFARGLGGVIGDQLFALAKLLASAAGPNMAASAAGGGLALTAAALFMVAVGGSAMTMRPALAATATTAREEPKGFAARQPPQDAPQRSVPDLAMPQIDESRFQAATAAQPQPAPLAVEESPATQSQAPMHVPYDDLPEDDDSRLIAQRFAPRGARAAIAEPVAEAAPRIGWKQILTRASDGPVQKPEPQPIAWEPVAMAAAPQPAEMRNFALEAEVPAAPASFAPPAPIAAPLRSWSEPPSGYRVPSPQLLARNAAPAGVPAPDNRELIARARRLEEVLAEYDVRCKIVGVVPGPAVTQFEIETAAGVKASRVVGLAQDIARALGLTSVRIVAVPVRASIVIELPNQQRSVVALRDLLDTRANRQSAHALPVAIGLSSEQEPIIADLTMLPGLLVAGIAGTGKTTALNAAVTSLLLRFAPADLRLLTIDPKAAGLGAFDGTAHLLAPAITDSALALRALEWCVAEMDERLKAMAKLNLRGITTYNNAVRNALRQGTGFRRAVQTGFDRMTGRAVYEEEIVTPKAMPYIVVAIDDLDRLVELAGPGVDAAFKQLSRAAASAGIHVVATATHLTSAALPAGIRSALPARICFKLGSKTESRIILGEPGAELLLGSGDFLFSIGGAAVRGQAPMVSPADIAAITDAVQRQARPSYEPALLARDPGPLFAEEDSEIYQQAVGLAMREGAASIDELEARLGIGSATASSLMSRMQEAGLVAATADENGRRPVRLGRAVSA